MAVKTRTEISRFTKKVELVPCVTCGEDVLPGSIHCNGSKYAYGCMSEGAHHGRQLWPDCWMCNAVMGCISCVPGAYQKEYRGQYFNNALICTRCRIKVTIESFLEGGPISRFSMNFDFHGKRITYHEAKDVPGLDAYPRQWLNLYAKQRMQAGRSIDDDEGPEFHEFLNMLRKFVIRDEMHIQTRKQLQAERNRQVDEVVTGGER